jgi:hypothetical protein
MSLILDGTNGLSDVDGTAATPAIRGTDTNTGIFFPAADTIAFSEGGTEQMRLNSAGDLQMNSGYGSVATAYGCRAWVNFNGQGTVTIRASANVSSVTDLNVGNYRVNFTNAMPDANFSATNALTSHDLNTDYRYPMFVTALATGSVTMQCNQVINGANVTDSNLVMLAVFR